MKYSISAPQEIATKIATLLALFSSKFAISVIIGFVGLFGLVPKVLIFLYCVSMKIPYLEAKQTIGSELIEILVFGLLIMIISSVSYVLLGIRIIGTEWESFFSHAENEDERIMMRRSIDIWGSVPAILAGSLLVAYYMLPNNQSDENFILLIIGAFIFFLTMIGIIIYQLYKLNQFWLVRNMNLKQFLNLFSNNISSFLFFLLSLAPAFGIMRLFMQPELSRIPSSVAYLMFALIYPFALYIFIGPILQNNKLANIRVFVGITVAIVLIFIAILPDKVEALNSLLRSGGIGGDLPVIAEFKCDGDEWHPDQCAVDPTPKPQKIKLKLALLGTEKAILRVSSDSGQILTPVGTTIKIDTKKTILAFVMGQRAS